MQDLPSQSPLTKNQEDLSSRLFIHSCQRCSWRGLSGGIYSTIEEEDKRQNQQLRCTKHRRRRAKRSKELTLPSSYIDPSVLSILIFMDPTRPSL
jgi:hypothetical protein